MHGRVITGPNNNDDFTFAPYERTCNLAPLTASKTIPSTGDAPASAAPPPPTPPPGMVAQFDIYSGFPPQGNPLAGVPFYILKDSYTNILAKAGYTLPAGMSPFRFVADACGKRSPDCQKALDAVKPNIAYAFRSDSSGHIVIQNMVAGTYYLMINTRYNNQGLGWDQAIEVKPGANKFTLDQNNATAKNN